MILSAYASPAPYGGAVRLTFSSDQLSDEYALILASNDAAAPNPVTREGCRVVHEGRLLMYGGALRVPLNLVQVIRPGTMYTALDLSSRDLPDGYTVYYHIWTMRPGQTFGSYHMVKATPSNVRRAAVMLARDTVRQRLDYHFDRAIERRELPPTISVVQVLELESLERGFDLPAVLVKESVSPSPQAEQIGKGGEPYRDSEGRWIHEYTHQTSARIDLLVLCADPELRSVLERFLHGACLADLDYYHAAGLENVQVSRNTRHDVDSASVNYFGVEITLTATIPVTVQEAMSDPPMKEGAAFEVYL